MEYLFLRELTTKQQNDFWSLYDLCRALDKIQYSIPDTTGADMPDAFIIAYDKATAVGCIFSYYYPDSHRWEISGITLPSFRRKGIFGKMLSVIRSRLDISDIFFTGKDSYPGIKECAMALGYPYCYHEYLMEFNGPCPVSLPLSDNHIDDFAIEYEESDRTYYCYLGDDMAGHCSVLIEDSLANIFDVCILPKFRQKGLGKRLVTYVMSDLSHQVSRIRLQVSETNMPAMRLYTGCGFVIKESTACYTQQQI